MSFPALVFRSLRFYWRTHLGVLAGAGVSAAVLVGALCVGDSVRGSLERIARARLGRVESALDAGNRFFRDDLAQRVRSALRAEVGTALRVRGMAIREEKQINRVEVLGVDRGFLKLAESPSGIELGPGDLAVNEKLALALGAKIGDDVALRIPKPGLLSRDAPLASRKEGDTARRLFTLRAVLSEPQLGRFSLKSDQAAPYNAFVGLSALQEMTERRGEANLIVAGTGEPADRALRDAWRIEDAGLRVRLSERQGILQLESPRVYLDPAVSEKELRARPDSVGVLSYLVNSIASEGGKRTPYSFVTSLSPSPDPRLGPVPAGMKDDEILVNRWLADHLPVRAGDRVKVAYSELGPAGTFVAKDRSFIVRGILEMDALAMEKELVPEFPGLTDVERCEDWEIGLPMDERELKDEANEKYWNAYRQTPKAFVTLRAGREMWANRFGDLMAIRYPAGATSAREIRSRIDPAEVGLAFRPVREQAMKAVSESVDVGPLFLGMSLFLVVASLLLTVLLFLFSVEQRAKEMGILLAMGHGPGRVRGLLWAEGAIVAALGSLGGIPLGWGFARFLIWGLGTAWSGAVARAPVEFHAGIGASALGAAAAAGMSLLAMGGALRRMAKRPVQQLVSEDFSLSLDPPGSGRASQIVFLLATGGAVATFVATLVSGLDRPVLAFFCAGALLLIGGMALVRRVLSGQAGASSAGVSEAWLGIRNSGRRPGRGLATAGILACGCFVLFSVSAMKENFSLEAGRRASGTGGFALIAESGVAVHGDLNEEKGRAAYRLTDASLLSGVSILSIKMREGDDASCLNLNQSLAPPLLGVDPARLGAFASPDLWELLERDSPEGIVPALVGDSATAVWKLKKKVGKEEGDLLDYTDERGKPFKVKLVGALPARLSVFQGRLLLSQRDFTRLYPSESGYRVFLIDVPAGSEDRVKGYLSEKLGRVGLDVVPSVEFLKELYVVESAYLTMFLVLGGLGLLLGGAGTGVLVLRTVMERRSELALLRAVGYSRAQVGRVVMAEHGFLVAAGLATGTAAALLAAAPVAAQQGGPLSYGLPAGFLLGTAALALVWIRIATQFALRGPFLKALRNE